MDGIYANGAGPMTILQMLVIARWIHFTAVFTLFGSAFFWFYAGERPSPVGADDLPASRRATATLLRVAAPVAAISGIVWLAGILANMANGFKDVLDLPTLRLFFMETQFGTVAFLRLILLAVAALVSLSPWRGRAWFSAQLHIGAMLLINQAWLGHASEGGAGPYGALMIIAYSLHVLAVAAWVGGLPPLLFALIEQGAERGLAARQRMLDLCRRFSRMGIVAVALACATGLANAGFRTGFSLEKLLHTDYGDVLLAKAGVVAMMLALAGYNRFVAMPRLSAAAPEQPVNSGALRSSIAIELILGILALGAAAVLGVTPPPQ